MASKSIFDQLLGSLGGSLNQPGGAPRQAGAGGQGGIGDLLTQISGALGGGSGANRGAGTGAGGGLSDLLGQIQGSLGQAGDRAGGLVGDKGSFAKGAAAGGLMGALLGGKGTAKAAGAAVIGTLAWRAYQNWQAQQQSAPAALSEEKFLPTGATAEQLSDKLARAMVAAAKADGQVTTLERRRITAALAERGVGSDAQRIVEEELSAPLDVAHIAALATTEEEAVQIYTASLLAVDPEGPEERAYLADLAARLGLPPDLVAHLNDTAIA